MLKVFLLRHTETKWNEELRYLGSTDLELSALGTKNAQLCAGLLKKEPLQNVYASSLKRAQQMATIIAYPHGLEIQTVDGLKEIDFGDWEGLTYYEIKEKYSQKIDEWLADPLGTAIPGGEAWRHFEPRVQKSWEAILKKEREGTIAIITHGGCIKVIIGHILKIPPSSYWQLYQDKGALNVIEVGERCRLLLLNDTCYQKGTISPY